MRKNKRKILAIVSILLIMILIVGNLIYINSRKENIEIQGIQSEYNAELQENEHMHLEEDESGDKIAVPNGYVGSKATGEYEIDTGYVIYEGIEEVNDSNVEEAQKTRNQYVWVPVPDASKMYGTDKNGKKWGKLYEFTTDTGEDIDERTGTKPLNWNESNGIMEIIDNNGYREPDKIRHMKNNLDMDSIVKTSMIGVETTHELLVQLEQEFNEMIESVERYGGFYIGRYETGDISKDKVIVRKRNLDIGGSQSWYTLYGKCKNLKNENIDVETGMVWGSQWDRTLIWLIESGNKTKEQICIDSSTWGNCRNSEFEYTSSNGVISKKEAGYSIKISTGIAEYTKANNIYDLAGNNSEWTTEAWSDRRVFRGGNCYSDSATVKGRNGYFPTDTSWGCRAMLYIK